LSWTKNANEMTIVIQNWLPYEGQWKQL